MPLPLDSRADPSSKHPSDPSLVASSPVSTPSMDLTGAYVHATVHVGMDYSIHSDHGVAKYYVDIFRLPETDGTPRTGLPSHVPTVMQDSTRLS